MNMPLYKMGVKSSWKMFVIFCAVLTMYFTIIITMFDPEMGNALAEFEKAMPELMAMVGMSGAGTTLAGFMASYLYGFIMLIFPMIFSIVVANRLLSHHIDHGSMAYLLAAPVGRIRIAFTQMKVLLSGILLMIAFATMVGLISSEVLFPGELDVVDYLILNLGALALQLFIGSICFLSSSIFNESKLSIAFGAGIPALSYILQMMANAGPDLEKIKYTTFFTLFNPKEIIAGETSAYIGMLILAVGAVILFGFAFVIFKKKDIPV